MPTSLRRRVKQVFLDIAGFFVPLFTFVPNGWMFFGFMSMPLLAYFSSTAYIPHLWEEIIGRLFDFSFLFDWHGLSELAGVVIFGGLILLVRAMILGGLCLFAYSLFYLYSKRKGGIVTSGPYSWVRHPQYLGLILCTGGVTVLVLPSSPVWVWGETSRNVAGIWILIVWLLEVSAYIVLAKIEDTHLHHVFEGEFAQYSEQVQFIIPHRPLTKQKGGI